jgi:hypothetical protein
VHQKALKDLKMATRHILVARVIPGIRGVRFKQQACRVGKHIFDCQPYTAGFLSSTQ